MKRTVAFLFALMCCLFVAGCCTDPVNGELYFCLGEMSDAEEAALGEEYASAFIAESGGVYPDAELNAYLEEIVVERMARQSHRPNLPWTFTVLNSSEVNAFALPGGKVFVTRGLVSRLESEAQFAHLMGHEIGHVTHRHALRGQGRNVLFAILVGTVAIAEDQIFDPDEPPVISTTAGALGQLTLLKFSRDQELQSDRRGVDYALRAGYDPREGVKTFEMFLRMKEESGRGEDILAGLLSTHPLDSRRVREIRSYIAQEYPSLPADLTVSPPGWGPKLARLRQANGVYEQHDAALALVQRAQTEKNPALLDDAQSILEKCRRSLPGHAAFPTALGVIALERNNHRAAERYLDDALNLQPDLFSARVYRGVVFQKTGRPDRAIVDFRRAHELHSAHPMPCYFLGSLYKAKGDAAQASGWFRMSLERSPRKTDIRRRSRAELEALAAAV